MLKTSVLRKLAIFSLTLGLCTSTQLLASQLDNDAYVGAEACSSCHQEEHQQWQQSDHHKAMQVATVDSVLGDFSNVTVRYHNIDSRFYLDKKHYYVDTLDETGTTNTLSLIHI
ncbi:MAG TPA: hypothetical protein ENI05_00885, partial [Porticoccus sp.]|nr:hypothetical protein [Porticoccus sp.]